MAVSLKKSPTQMIDPAASYAAYLHEGDLMHQFAILSGSTAINILETSPNPHLIEFRRLT